MPLDFTKKEVTAHNAYSAGSANTWMQHRKSPDIVAVVEPCAGVIVSMEARRSILGPKNSAAAARNGVDEWVL